MPSTKPDLSFDDEGVCSACRNYEARQEIPWASREKEFVDLLSDSGSGPYDCVVPVSGGKDSTVQVLNILKLGFRPLAVNARTCDLSSIGRRNLDNIRRLGVDLVEVAPNSKVRAKLNREGLETVGDISWPEHVSIFTIPVRVAKQYGVRTIVWGENPQHEYGGPQSGSRTLDRRWLEEFGGLLGLRVTDLGFTKQELALYTYPTDVEDIQGVFMGYFFPWDGFRNAAIARSHGFEWAHAPVEASGFRYENLDNRQTGIHDFFKYIKFGFGRATDIACTHVRRGRWTRNQAWLHVREWDGKFPWWCIQRSLRDILEPLGLGIDDFIEIAEEFVNRDILDGSVTSLAIKKNHTDAAS